MLNEQKVTPPPVAKDSDEFVAELVIKPATEATTIAAITQVKIKNPDGQLAEWTNPAPPPTADSGTGEENSDQIPQMK
jgi:hypothetical protein